MPRDVRSARHPVPTQDESQGQRAGACAFVASFVLGMFFGNRRPDAMRKLVFTPPRFCCPLVF